MEIRDFALRIVTSEHLAEKLTRAPRALTDRTPRPACCPSAPGRPPQLRIRPARDVRVPSRAGWSDPQQRPRILHALANHELQAVELFAWALLAYPDAPRPFRRGLLRVLADEQRHTRMYARRLEEMGSELGAFPVSGYFWNKVDRLRTPLEFVCAMSLTFENANLDHTVDLAATAAAAGDRRSAAVIRAIHRDETRHVRFGWTWLERLKGDGENSWDAYTRSLHWPLRPERARGERFYPTGRSAAGLPAAFIERLAASRS